MISDITPRAKLFLENPTVEATFLASIADQHFCPPRQWSKGERLDVPPVFSNEPYGRELLEVDAYQAGRFLATANEGSSAPLEMTSWVSIRATVYGKTVVAVTFSIALRGVRSIWSLNRILNAMVSDDTILKCRGRPLQTFPEFASTVLLESGVSIPWKGAGCYPERFTSLSASAWVPNVSIGEQLSDELRRELFAAAFRRPLTFDEYLLDDRISRHGNVSQYRDEYVACSRHGMLLLIPTDPTHLPSRFYIDAYERRRVLVFLLLQLDSVASVTVRSLQSVPHALRRLKKETTSNGNRIMLLTQWRDLYQPTPLALASRARNFEMSVDRVLGVDESILRLDQKLGDIESVIASRYTIRLQVALQWFSLTLAFLSLLVGMVGVIVAAGLLRP